ncbi:recombination mediator RecR [Fodinicurvata sediminis]|uniref:recombination mediator RecR n=1 Tax=Fodinicurvata sediminis TaxID=1121832 RepID=UPI0003B45A7E|nr:recombination mediator RecR [Fodinicurvata sediminis]
MSLSDIDRMIQLLARLPGLGPRSARRATLNLLQRREDLLRPLADALVRAADNIQQCAICGNLDDSDPCRLCQDGRRDPALICVVEEIGDLWALERSGVFQGRYHVLGGTLSALDGRGPEQLNLSGLWKRAEHPDVKEVVLALSATVDGQTTAHYITERLAELPVEVTRLGQGVPVGGALDYLDDGTLTAAFRARRPASG